MPGKVVFFGNEKLATGVQDVQPLIREAVEAAGFEIEQIVTGKLSELKPHKANIAVLAAYGRIIPQSVIDEFPLGIINVHPSLLPQYRGTTPIEQAILDGVSKTGVSIMQLTAGMDEGPIFKQKIVHLNGHESKSDLVGVLQQLGADLIADVLPGITEGTLKPRSQPHPDRATYSRKLTKVDGIIDWKKSAIQIEREIRAFLEWPKSRTKLGGKDVIITKAHAHTEVLEDKPMLATVHQEGACIMVSTGQGTLCIDFLKPAGKNEMTAASFIAGYGQLLKY